MKYCSKCAQPVTLRIPPGDNLPRFICDRCGKIFYQNPRIVVGTLPRWENKVLICRRSIEPRVGYWTLPSGYLENGETVEGGALRETLEEAGARVSVVRLFSVFSLPHVGQIYLIFLSDLADFDFAPGEETLEVRLVDRGEVPWKRIAFRAIEFTLQRYFSKCEGSDQEVHVGAYHGKKQRSWTLAEEE